MGLLKPSDYDEYKRIWLETDPILFTVTAIVSCLHTIFEFLAFKNDIQFWNGKESVEGISVKTLYINIVMSVIVCLYLFDNETSLLILVPQVLNIFLDVWKLNQASRVERTPRFPYFRLADKQSYAESETKKYDEEAMKYLSYGMYPLMAVYTIYSAVYNKHKGWYSFILNTAVGGIYVYGFILMTPQLYINYKLQSVEHMPQRTLFYRFLSTIIDDLFSFIITMPTLHRISCFRDDVIFVVYLYQRYAYRVDKTRGMYATERTQAQLADSVAQGTVASSSAPADQTEPQVQIQQQQQETVAVSDESKKDR